ncbi:Copper ion binding protein [Syntrophomonas zehnderi OL-4]|uniref:Copper chaperone CopZ n=1 Tax=Syntrophomonas zehnderi OL-4 TaxID=690567 RepID=A0A0E4GBF4_9FIRM|nr:copper chaperone CopZ [Syntrophomonas zehnderi]CFX41334.1 Copper ion binding protein [Syntrophomonas zehnderi OL-4]
MAGITIKVGGMSCSHCEQSVKTALGSLAGVKKVEVELSSGQVTIDYDPDKVDIKTIQDTIEDQGYEVKNRS